MDKVLADYDTGSVINPPLFEGQSERGIVGGAGYALTEEIMMGEGRVLIPNLHTYLVPTAPASPVVGTYAVPSSDGQRPFSAKGIGEPAISNAVYRPRGLRFTPLPITPEKVHRQLGWTSGRP